ncbi:glycosyltransferase [Pseudomonas sp. dw_358]|uniref:glycosyltransferase family 2 protein n=1 Tax=Pseudomonas sp. dw_358 TaxID=2720083 RepID=UPI001BD4CE0A|nr:glycosyltransferase [Pseudomonas sp. dw_358]
MLRSPSDELNFSIVLVNYKSLELTQTCLTLLHEKLQGAYVPVYVVDNDSNDASTEYLRTLSWITLIERAAEAGETGTVAHGRALDLALKHIETEYVFLLHTDTFIHDFHVFELMLAFCNGSSKVAAVGCLEQLDRGLPRTLWRLSSRFAKHYYRRTARALGVMARPPKPYKETHLKSFCAVWNVRIMKQHGLHFQMDERCPGYALQDRMIELGYCVKFLSPRTVFRYLDHVQSGTVSAQGGYGTQHRRADIYRQQMETYKSTRPIATPRP